MKRYVRASGITIKPIKDIDALRAVEALQIEIWGAQPLDVVPAHQLLAAAGAGGVVLGGYDSDGTLVGFCYGFAGWRDGRQFLYSHMAGVTREATRQAAMQVSGEMLRVLRGERPEVLVNPEVWPRLGRR